MAHSEWEGELWARVYGQKSERVLSLSLT